MGVMNLVLAVVVDRSVEAREQNKERILKEKQMQIIEQKLELLQTIAEYDTDEGGTLSRTELEQACTQCSLIQKIMAEAEVSSDDLAVILDALEAESADGEVCYGRFVNLIHDLESGDTKKLAVMGHLVNTYKHDKHDKHLQHQAKAIAAIDTNL